MDCEKHGWKKRILASGETVEFAGERLWCERDRLREEVERLQVAHKAEVDALVRDNMNLFNCQHGTHRQHHDEMDSLRAENERLRVALEAVEWVPELKSAKLYESARCPWCCGWEDAGHAPDCQRQAALHKKEE